MASRTHKRVLVTGANGYIGNAIARAFVRAGWTTYGLVRKESAIRALAAEEIIPILGSLGAQTAIPAGVYFHVIVSTTEQWPDYVSHYQEIIAFLRAVATTSGAAEVRPLVMFTSGCKDYGMMDKLATSTGLTPHTEETSLNPPPMLQDRTTYAMKTFENVDLFDTVLLRPTNVYGRSSSFFGDFFKLGAEVREKGILELREHPETILHALHVDSCGEAYVAIAEKPDVVKGQCYNISSYRFETLDKIAQALVKEFDIKGGIKYQPLNYGPEQRADRYMPRFVLGFSQWVSSEKLRKDVGWNDTRALFSEGFHQYRLAYEVAVDGDFKTIDIERLIKV